MVEVALAPDPERRPEAVRLLALQQEVVRINPALTWGGAAIF